MGISLPFTFMDNFTLPYVHFYLISQNVKLISVCLVQGPVLCLQEFNATHESFPFSSLQEQAVTLLEH
jgi:hypothetical protein